MSTDEHDEEDPALEIASKDMDRLSEIVLRVPPGVYTGMNEQLSRMMRDALAVNNSSISKIAAQLAGSTVPYEAIIKELGATSSLAKIASMDLAGARLAGVLTQSLSSSYLSETIAAANKLSARNLLGPMFTDLEKSLVKAAERSLIAVPPPNFLAFANLAADGWRQTLDAAIVSPPPSPGRLSSLGATTLHVVEIGNDLGEAAEEANLEDERWREGREQLTDHLSSWLGQACPKAVPKLRGAWHALTSNGPDAASQAANSGVEALDWTLRTIAPDDEVLAWRENVGQYAKEIDPKNGKPHRALRVRYAVRGFGMKSDGVTVIIMMMTRCLDELQGVKHGVDETKTIAAARRALLALENTLTALMPY